MTSHTTVINNGGGGGGGGFWSGYLWGSAMSQPTVVVEPVQVGTAAVAPANQQVVVVQHGFFFYAIWGVLLLALVLVLMAWAAEVWE